jgi:hypothetical protein
VIRVGIEEAPGQMSWFEDSVNIEEIRKRKHSAKQ